MQFTLLLCLLVVPMTLSFDFRRSGFERAYSKLPSRVRPTLDNSVGPLMKRNRPAPVKRSNYGFLKIQKAPPKLLEARQHGKTTLECSASGNPAPRITWYKDGEPLIKEYISDLVAGDYGEFSIESLGETKSIISLDCVSQKDAGLYECVAHTDKKKTSVETQVQVVSFEPNGCVPRHAMDFDSSPPLIFQWMETYMQIIGREGHIVCRTEGQDSISWFGPNDDEIIPDDSKYSLKYNGDLIIKDLNFKDMGMYRCLAKNSIGEDMKETFVYPLAPDESDTA